MNTAHVAEIAMEKMIVVNLLAAFEKLLADEVVLSEREVQWTEYKIVRVSRQYWENDLDSKFTEVPVTRSRAGYFLGDEEILPDDYFRLRRLVEAHTVAPILVACMREIEAAPGWEWIDCAAWTIYYDRLSELVPQVRATLECCLSENSLGLSEAVSTAKWRIEQVEKHLPALAAAKVREAEGCSPFFGGWLHTSGQNGRARFWVVRPDGTLREPDRDEYSRSHQRGIHTGWWSLVQTDELGLWWAKGSNASEHAFEVRHRPVGRCTEAQLAAVVHLEDELEAEWGGRRGLASGALSPSVGEGWGLIKRPGPEPDSDSPFAVLRKLKG